MKRSLTFEPYRRIEKAIVFLERNFNRRPGLKEIAKSVNLSEYHFQRLFRRWAGISPKRFLQLLTVEHTKKMMENSGSLLDLTHESGLSSPSRLHDLFVNVEAVTPDEFRKRGRGISILYGFHPSSFGECLIAVTGRGICYLAFVGPGGRGKTLGDLKEQWSDAEIGEGQSATKPYADKIFGSAKSSNTLTLHVQGTNLQVKVWQALLRIPRGRLVSYEAVAREVGRPGAIRAVANAVARNPVAFLIPCHRVIRKTGAIGKYRWGSARKKAMLAWEAGKEEKGRG
ncbi:MAG TPA: methylated-DNA--[protein]-cysteine S-methyltransferase [Thermodesulfovibrionales bacterium]|nr:methylated-DNA--[protein]-cysteine S-methyltransferase [Thermodesulfovibrionales bacterium]